MATDRSAIKAALSVQNLAHPEQARRPHQKHLVYLNYYVPTDRLRGFKTALRGTPYHPVADPLPADASEQVVVIVHKTREITDAVVERFPKLRHIILIGSEDWMITASLSGIQVTLLQVERGYDVAEHAIALMLAGCKRLHRLDRKREWLSPRRWYRTLRPKAALETGGAHNWSHLPPGRTVLGQTVGIVGYGAIGRQIHRRLEGFAPAEVLYNSSTRYSDPVENLLGIRYASLDALFAACDIIFLQLPLRDSTMDLIDRAVLRHARPHTILINCGRAGVVNKADLHAALRQRRLCTYAADVFWHEPMPLWDSFRWSSRYIITPHSAENHQRPVREMDLVLQAVKELKA